MGTPSFSLLWAPALIGMAIGFALYGTSVGQYLFYIRFFSEDHYILKSVFTVFMLDTANTIITGSLYWEMLVTCRWSIAPECTGGLPWQMKANVIVICLLTFCVQWCDV
ncbi:hypothetical protein V8B97DRAFT_1113486 [Scleroderma yunnanense]